MDNIDNAASAVLSDTNNIILGIGDLNSEINELSQAMNSQLGPMDGKFDHIHIEQDSYQSTLLGELEIIKGDIGDTQGLINGLGVTGVILAAAQPNYTPAKASVLEAYFIDFYAALGLVVQQNTFTTEINTVLATLYQTRDAAVIARQMLKNKFEIDDETSQIIIYDDDDITPLFTCTITDKNGDPVKHPSGVLTGRSRYLP